ncbi:sulfotransferase [Neptunitalea lumnitzerae]|uniref:Sulfotransferase family protein n=1 Tax=Neptunitalea lumnitzerae TaxID=2965509 RepID=A0ABQ5MGZ1_9FLAO|nr:sulfotransferase [Neptunitalea sp. Y10]GLB48654.1 sulfotransferase family protein [Neptunitalea sp. Y10]
MEKYQLKNLYYYYVGKHFYKMYNLKPKVFGIGLNRTGSSSLGRFFEMLGYKHSFECYGAEKLKIFLNDKAALKKEMDKFEMHEDWPTAQVYKLLAEYYPDAKFILTLRDTPEQWFNSLLNTSGQEAAPFNKTKELIYGYGVITEAQREELIGVYENHIKEVTEFFSNTPERLLILKTSDKNKNDKICDFLNISRVNFDFPHSQKRSY